MMLKLNCSKQRGISLLEVLLSLAVIAIILVMATRYYKSAQQSQQASNALSMLSGIVTAETQYRAANNNAFTDIKGLTAAGYLPANFGTDPWGGEIGLVVATTGGFTITMPGPIPAQTCTILMGLVNSGSGTATCPGGTTLSANYQ